MALFQSFQPPTAGAEAEPAGQSSGVGGVTPPPPVARAGGNGAEIPLPRHETWDRATWARPRGSVKPAVRILAHGSGGGGVRVVGGSAVVCSRRAATAPARATGESRRGGSGNSATESSLANWQCGPAVL